MSELLGCPEGRRDVAHSKQKKNQNRGYNGELDRRGAAAVLEDAVATRASSGLGAVSRAARYEETLTHQHPVPELTMLGFGSLLKTSVDFRANQLPLVVPLADVMLVVLDNILISGIEGTGHK